MKMKRLVLCLALTSSVIPGCGSSSPAAPTPPAPTPTPAPNYSGTYSGPMTFNVAQQAEIRVIGRTTLTQNGNSIDFSGLVITGIPNSAQYQLGTATLVGNTFTGASTYQSAGCGRVEVSFNGRFAGNLMNLTHVLIPQTCDRFELRGELTKQ